MKQEDARNPNERPIQRSRHLQNEDEIWNHNSWDDAKWTEEQEAEAIRITQLQEGASPHISNEDAVEQLVSSPAADCWDRFYQHHDRWFFKDRRWLTSEFPELFNDDDNNNNSTRNILEVGCGAGNTVFPLARFLGLEKQWHLWACDFSPKAVDLVRENREFNPEKMTAFVYDLMSGEPIPLVPPESIDAVLAIFVLSALDPAHLKTVFTNIAKVLRPGGIFLIRDYGLHDMTQLRFKPERLIRPNLYIRGDGTGVHFFTQPEIENLAQQTGLSILANEMDRRLLVNRFRKLRMYRVWLQAKLQKPA